MSGAEAILVLGLISSVITVVDATKKVYEAAANTEGLPEAFRSVAARLPIIRSILDSTMQQINVGDLEEISCRGVRNVVAACHKKANKLDELFNKVIPSGNATRIERYLAAVRALGKVNRVEILMKGMLEDIQLLTSNHGIKTVTEPQLERLANAIKDISAIPPSVSEHQGTNDIHNPGLETNYNAGQDQYNNYESMKMYKAHSKTFGSDSSTLGSDGSLEDTCMSALFLTDPHDDRKRLMRIKGGRVNGTCQWIKTNKLYDSWLHSHSQLLWVSGGPGKGKTMLSMFLAEELERAAKYSSNTLFLQYFCDNKDGKRNTATAVVRGLIFQLLELRPRLFDHILPRFKIEKESLFTASLFETLWRIFTTMVCDPGVGTIYCILDGLDECEDSSELLLHKFRALFSMTPHEESTCHLNLIIASRDRPEFIPEILSSFPRIQLDLDADTEVNKDIQRFIDDKIDELSALRHYPKPLNLHVKEVFHSRAQGTFLWVGIVADQLRKYKKSEVEEALDRFPPGLEELYARMLLQIDIGRREIATKILRWVVLAVRPLTLSELSAAVDIRHSDMFNCDEVMGDQVSYCGSFLTIKENEVSLLHQSAKDYLLRDSHDPNPELEAFRIKKYSGNLEIARKCFYYLQDGALAGGSLDPDGRVYSPKNTNPLKVFPLLSYATLHWLEHAKPLASSEDIFDVSLPFYDKKSPIRKAWLTTYGVKKMHNSLPDSFTLLHVASWFGLLQLAENLISKKSQMNRLKLLHYLNKRDERRQTALHWAAERGHEELVQLLLDNGANIEAKGYNNSTPLLVAVQYGQMTVIRLLLNRGSNVQAKNRYNETALHIAAWHGHVAIVRLLLDQGVNIEAKNRWVETALHAAVWNRQMAVVRLLLNEGADITARNCWNQTALHKAVWHGQVAIVQLLLDEGADITARNCHAETALHIAAHYGQVAVVRLLVDRGAEIEATDVCGRTALREAAIKEQEAVVKLLLKLGADAKQLTVVRMATSPGLSYSRLALYNACI